MRAWDAVALRSKGRTEDWRMKAGPMLQAFYLLEEKWSKLGSNLWSRAGDRMYLTLNRLFRVLQIQAPRRKKPWYSLDRTTICYLSFLIKESHDQKEKKYWKGGFIQVSLACALQKLKELSLTPAGSLQASFVPGLTPRCPSPLKDCTWPDVTLGILFWSDNHITPLPPSNSTWVTASWSNN